MNTQQFNQTCKQILYKEIMEFYWLARGLSIHNPKPPSKPKSFLFVCTGNICRSPFAELLALKICSDLGLKDLQHYSAGLDVSVQAPSPQEAILAAEDFHVSLHNHHANKIDPEIIKCVHMVITFEYSHIAQLKKTFPEYMKKLFLLPLYSSNAIGIANRYNIVDPYGKSTDDFRACYQRIHECLVSLFSCNMFD
jgi:protein-tyrosine phosphatase